MPRAAPAIESFNGGEFSPLLAGRTSLEKYPSACDTLENFIPTVQGPAHFRPGTRFVGECLLQATRSWLTRFEFNYEQASVLEFNDGALGFISDRGRVVQTLAITGAANDGTGRIRLTIAGHGLVAGLEVTVADVGGIPNATGTWRIECPSSGTIDLVSSTFGGTYTSGGEMVAPLVVQTPYAAADLENPDGTCSLSFLQSGDVVYIAGGGQPPQKLSRLSATSWTIAELIPDDGPFMDMNEDETLTIQADDVTGTVTLTASADVFTAAHVGALIRLERYDADGMRVWEPDQTVSSNDVWRISDGNEYLSTGAVDGTYPSTTGSVRPTHTRGIYPDAGFGSNVGIYWEYQNSGYGVARITAYTSPTEVDAEVLTPLPFGVENDGTWRWKFGAWGDHNEYPRFVSLWKERLVFAGLRDVWLSKSAEYEKFAPDEFNEQVAESAVNIRLQSRDNNAIRWMEAGVALFVGTADAEFVIAPASTSNPYGPTNSTVDARSAYGGSGVRALKVGKSVFFVEKNQRRVREIVFDEATAYSASDRTLLAEHITSPGVTWMVHQRHPWSVVWAGLTDGGLIGYTHEPDQQVFGWHRHPQSGVVESATVIPSPDGSKDDVFFCVRRGSARYLEFLEALLPADGDQEDAFHVDCGLTYDGAAATTISGLDHLEGETVKVLADGATHPDRTVSGGAITLAAPAEVVHVGLGYVGRIRPMRLDAGSADGTAQTKTKRLGKCSVRLYRSLGGRMGSTWNDLEEIQYRTPSMPMDSPPPLYTGDKSVTLNSGYETDGYICVEQHQPLPMTVVALYPRVTTNN